MVRIRREFLRISVCLLALAALTAGAMASVKPIGERRKTRSERNEKRMAFFRRKVDIDSLKPTTKHLATLKKGHPRLFFSTADHKRIERLAKTDKQLAQLMQQVIVNADNLIDKPCVEYEIPDGLRLLGRCRSVLGVVSTSAMACRLTGKQKYADRAIKEMLHACKYPDWNPIHFLDTAEMTMAMAIGYDWLYDRITPADRKTIEAAMVEKGLKPGLLCYQKGYWWVKGTNNWNQVCNGGMTLGALALADKYPKLAETIVDGARKSIPRSMHEYAPHGAYPEGPGYYHYGTMYNCLMIAGLQSALGSDLGLLNNKPFGQSGMYRIHTISPLGYYFNYPDCGLKAGPIPEMFYLAKAYNQPMYAWAHRQRLAEYYPAGGEVKPRRTDRNFAMEIVWYDSRGTKPSAKQLPLDAYFDGKQPVVTMRSAWGDRKALYVGIKGGYNRAGHAHMDIGSFVLDWFGRRWMSDFGSENYNLPGYWDFRQNGGRWKYYRLNNKGHNTLVIADKLQRATGRGKVIAFSSAPARTHTVIDMTTAYQPEAKKVLRGLAMIDKSRVIIQDEITGAVGPIRWAIHTRSKTKIDSTGRVIKLRQGNDRIQMRIVAPKAATWNVAPATPPTDKENPNKGYSVVSFTAKPSKEITTLQVVIEPVAAKTYQPAIKPLKTWKSKSK